MNKLDKYKKKYQVGGFNSTDFVYKGDPTDLKEVTVYGKKPRENNLNNISFKIDNLSNLIPDFKNILNQVEDRQKFKTELELSKKNLFDKIMLETFSNKGLKNRKLQEQFDYLYGQTGNSLPKDNFIQKWTDSPMHLEMLKKSDPKNYQDTLEKRKENLNSTTVEFSTNPNPRIGGESFDNGKVILYPKNSGAHEKEGIYIHESSHSSDRPIEDNVIEKYFNFYGKLLTGKDTKNTSLTDRIIPESDINTINKYKDPENRYGNYVSEPTETRARLNEIRWFAKIHKFYDPLNEKLSRDNYDKMINSYKVKFNEFSPFDSLKKVYSDEEIFNMLNTISSNDSQSSIESDLAQRGGYSPKVIAEDKEYVKTSNDQIIKIKDAPTHNDNIIATEVGNKKVSSGKGGVMLNNVKSVLSATHENRNSKDKLYTYRDEEIKIMPKEAKIISEHLHLPIKLQNKGISPAKLLDELIDKRENILKRYKDLKKEERNSDSRFNSIVANKAIVASIPDVKQLYDTVFKYSESKKSENQSTNFKLGGDIGDTEHYEDRAQTGKPIYVDSKNDPRYKAYQDSLNLYNKGKKEDKEYNDFIKKYNIPKKVTRQWVNPVDDENNINTRIEPIQGKGFIYNHNPNVISGTNIPSKLSNNMVMIYKKPQQPVLVIPSPQLDSISEMDNWLNKSGQEVPQIVQPQTVVQSTIPNKFRKTYPREEIEPYRSSGNFRAQQVGGKILPKDYFTKQDNLAYNKPVNQLQLTNQIALQNRVKEKKYLNPDTTNTGQRILNRENSEQDLRTQRINERQQLVNNFALATAPIPVVGEIINTGNLIAQGAVDLGQGEYGDAALSGVGLGISKIPFGKIFNKHQLNDPNTYYKTLDKAGYDNAISKIPNTSNFKSEIDWSKWNKEIPENPQLMKEYNVIEQQTKANGTWMKNVDGSNFGGTPEQFVQVQSNNFKKAYPNDYGITYRGVDFNEPVLTVNKGNTGVFTANYNLAKNYSRRNPNLLDANSFTKRDALLERLRPYKKKYRDDVLKYYDDKVLDVHKFNPEFENMIHGVQHSSPVKSNGVHQLYYPETNNKLIYEAEGRNFSNIDGKGMSTDDFAQKMQKESYNQALINNVDDLGLGNVLIHNHVPGNFLKSTRGNNGMFNMTNPNIYKSLIPLTVGASTLTNQKQTGGEVIKKLKNVNPNYGKDWETLKPLFKGYDKEVLNDFKFRYGDAPKPTVFLDKTFPKEKDFEELINENIEYINQLKTDENHPISKKERFNLADRLTNHVKDLNNQYVKEKEDFRNKTLVEQNKLQDIYKNDSTAYASNYKKIITDGLKEKDLEPSVMSLYTLNGRPTINNQTTDRANYFPYLNELTIRDKNNNPTVNFNNLIAEMSHAKSFNILGNTSMGNLKEVSKNNPKALDDKEYYDKTEYNRKGSEEYNAHQIIQPKFQTEYFSNNLEHNVDSILNVPAHKNYLKTIKKKQTGGKLNKYKR